MHHAFVFLRVSPPEPSGLVPHLILAEVARLATVSCGRNCPRDELLTLTLFQTGLRNSEALSLTTHHLGSHRGDSVLQIRGKGGKAHLVACPKILAAASGALQSTGKQGQEMGGVEPDKGGVLPGE